ncbi:MAG: hypothetical protein HYU84_02270 [Chloroflexi bacterium]|nr:hypothetical protein [Chloroflexota bacterium]
MFKYGIIENLETTRRIRIGQFWNVSLLITPWTWLGPFVFFGLHFLLNLLDTRLALNERLFHSIYFVLAVEVTTALHAFGHILSGKLIHSAMDELLITATRDVNVYHGDQSQIPGYVHLIRSLGGPIFNIIVGIFCIFIAKWIPSGFWTGVNTSMISTNFFFGLGGLLPIPSVDGEVIWREIANWMKKK